MAGLHALIKTLIGDLVAANRILASEGIFDAFGHVSVRHPENPGRYLLSRARAPELVEAADILEFALDGVPVDPRAPTAYKERFIHGALYEARPDIQAVVHNHSRKVIPFSISEEKLRPLLHNCATIGNEVPVWDAQDKFGDTDLLVSNMAMGRDLARVIGGGTCALMRGHGCTVAGKSLQEAVYTSIFLGVNAELQWKASRFGKVKFLSPGEIEAVNSMLYEGKPGDGFDRAWEYWSRRAGVKA